MALIWQDNLEGAGPNLGGGTRTAVNHVDTANGTGGGGAGTTGNYFVRTNIAGEELVTNGFNATFTGFEGSFLWRAEDVEDTLDNAGSGGTVLTVLQYSGIDISGKSGLSFTALFGGRTQNVWEGDEDFQVWYEIDGGGYVLGLSFKDNGVNNLVQDVNLDGVINASDAGGVTLSEAMQNVSFNIAGTGSTLNLRVIANVQSSEEVAFDNLRLNDSAPPPIDGDGLDNVLVGTAGADVINGFDGNDVLKGNAGADTLNGGTGIDTASYSQAGAGVTIDLTNTANNTGDAAGDIYNSIERYFGSFLDDIFIGNGGNNQFRGRDGDDQFFGNGGIDTFYGDAGADSFDGGDGSDIVSYATSKSGIVLDLTDGMNSTGDAAGDTFTSIERINGSSFGDTMTGDAGENRFFGLGGNDTLNGEGGDDWLYGSSGEDILNGGAGFDRFFGGNGDDTMTGGAGRDVFYFGANQGTDTITDFDQDGNDVLVFQAASGATELTDLLILQNGADVVIVYSGGVLNIQNQLVADMTADDFIFAG